MSSENAAATSDSIEVFCRKIEMSDGSLQCLVNLESGKRCQNHLAKARKAQITALSHDIRQATRLSNATSNQLVELTTLLSCGRHGLGTLILSTQVDDKFKEHLQQLREKDKRAWTAYEERWGIIMPDFERGDFTQLDTRNTNEKLQFIPWPISNSNSEPSRKSKIVPKDVNRFYTQALKAKVDGKHEQSSINEEQVAATFLLNEFRRWASIINYHGGARAFRQVVRNDILAQSVMDVIDVLLSMSTGHSDTLRAFNAMIREEYKPKHDAAKASSKRPREEDAAEVSAKKHKASTASAEATQEDADSQELSWLTWVPSSTSPY